MPQLPGHVAPGILSLGQIDRGQQADRLAGGLKPGIVDNAGPTGEGDHAGDGKIRLFLEEIVLRYPGLASEGECILDGDPIPIKAKGTAEGTATRLLRIGGAQLQAQLPLLWIKPHLSGAILGAGRWAMPLRSGRLW